MSQNTSAETRNTLKFGAANFKHFQVEESEAARAKLEREYAEAMRGWIGNSFKNGASLAATVTINPAVKHLSEQAAVEALMQYNRIIDRKAYGSASYKGRQLETLWVREGGSNTASRLHFHGVVEVPDGIDIEKFAFECKMAWQTKIRVAGRTENTFKPVHDIEGWAGYITKRWSKPDPRDYLVLEATRLNHAQSDLH